MNGLNFFAAQYVSHLKLFWMECRPIKAIFQHISEQTTPSEDEMMFVSFHFLGTLDAKQLAGQLDQEKNDKIWATQQQIVVGGVFRLEGHTHSAGRTSNVTLA